MNVIYFDLLCLKFGHTRRKWYSVSISLLQSGHTLSANGVNLENAVLNTGVKLDGKSIWKIHMDFFFRKSFFS